METGYLSTKQRAIMFKKLNERWLVIITIIGCGLPIWFTSYKTDSNNGFIYVSIIISGILAAIFSLLTNLWIVKIILCSVISFLAALSIKLAIDIFIDPTSHSLFGLEIIFGGFYAFIAAAAGASLGFLFKRIPQFIKR